MTEKTPYRARCAQWLSARTTSHVPYAPARDGLSKRKLTVYFRDTSDAGSGRPLAPSAATAKEPTMKNTMKKQKDPENPDVERTQPADEGDTHRMGEGTTDMREANDNIRKSQGDDAGLRPTIDRHR
jgi:hypothetical protein